MIIVIKSITIAIFKCMIVVILKGKTKPTILRLVVISIV